MPNIDNRFLLRAHAVICGASAALPADYSQEQVNFAGHFVVNACTRGAGCHYLFRTLYYKWNGTPETSSTSPADIYCETAHR